MRGVTQGRPAIVDVELPVPPVIDDATVLLVPAMCSEMVNDALRGTRRLDEMLRMKDRARKCLAARLYAMCAEAHVVMAGDEDEWDEDSGHPASPKAATAVLEDARRFRDDACTGVRSTRAADDIFIAVMQHRQFKKVW